LPSAAAEAGADIIELGIPFSDPLADGPVIQAAYTRALAAGTTVRDVIGHRRRNHRTTSPPVVLMTALNPVIAYGIERVLPGRRRRRRRRPPRSGPPARRRR
jgi:tryptophan synthase alpha chain